MVKITYCFLERFGDSVWEKSCHEYLHRCLKVTAFTVAQVFYKLSIDSHEKFGCFFFAISIHCVLAQSFFPWLYSDAKTMCNKAKFLEKTGFCAQVITWLLKCMSQDNSTTNQHRNISGIPMM